MNKESGTWWWFPSPLMSKLPLPFSSSSSHLQDCSWVSLPAWLFPRNQFHHQWAWPPLGHGRGGKLHHFTWRSRFRFVSISFNAAATDSRSEPGGVACRRHLIHRVELFRFTCRRFSLNESSQGLSLQSLSVFSVSVSPSSCSQNVMMRLEPTAWHQVRYIRCSRCLPSLLPFLFYLCSFESWSRLCFLSSHWKGTPHTPTFQNVLTCPWTKQRAPPQNIQDQFLPTEPQQAAQDQLNDVFN